MEFSTLPKVFHGWKYGEKKSHLLALWFSLQFLLFSSLLHLFFFIGNTHVGERILQKDTEFFTGGGVAGNPIHDHANLKNEDKANNQAINVFFKKPRSSILLEVNFWPFCINCALWYPLENPRTRLLKFIPTIKTRLNQGFENDLKSINWSYFRMKNDDSRGSILQSSRTPKTSPNLF